MGRTIRGGLRSALILLALAGTAERAEASSCFGFGIGRFVTCWGSCPPGQSCEKFEGEIFGIRQDYCDCVEVKPPAPGGGDYCPPIGSPMFMASQTGGELGLSGTMSTPLADDPMNGASMVFSGTIGLFGAQVQPNGVGLALYLPVVPTRMTVGDYFSARLDAVVYVGSGGEGKFSLTLTDLQLGSSFSPLAQRLYETGSIGLGIGIHSPVDLFGSIAGGGFQATGLEGVGQTICTPEPSTFAAAGLACLVGSSPVVVVAVDRTGSARE